MIATSKITRKNQTTLPKVVINVLGVKPSDRLVYEIEEHRVILHAKTGRLADLAGKFSHFGKYPHQPLPIEEMSHAVAQAVAENYKRKFGPRKRRCTK